MVKEGYKETEIGIIPEEWKVKKLNDIATPKARIGWQNLRKEEYLTVGDYLLITGTDFSDGKIMLDKCYYVSKERYIQDKNIQISNGSILITKDGTLGKIAFVEGLNNPATLNAGIFVLNNLDDGVDNRFLYQYLRTGALLDYAYKTSTGGTIRHLNQNVLIDFCVPCPSLHEQKNIAEALSDIDNLISSLEKVIEKKKAIKQACLQKMFPKYGETTPEMRLPGFTEPWEQRKLGEVVRLNGRIGFRGYTEKDIVSKDEGGVLTFSPTNIVNNTLTTNCKNTYITRFKYDESPEIKIHNGDILFVKTGSTLGKSALVTGLFEDATLNPQVVVMRSNKHNTEFLAALLITNSIFSQVNADKIGGAVPTLTETKIKDFNVAIPVSESEKTQIGQFFTNLDHFITLHQRKLEKYKKIKQGMMQQLLTGKIRIL